LRTIRANREKYPREALTKHMVADGHDPSAIEAAWSRLTPIPTPVVVRSYRAKTQEQAAQLFQADSAQMAAAGYYPVSQSWAPGQWGCGAFLIALLLAIVLIGILIFIYLLVVKPDGTLTVTYQHRGAPA
jgi:hypothetical protein